MNIQVVRSRRKVKTFLTAVTKLHGACARAFIILPLVSAFFIDIANAEAIGFMVR